MLNIGIQKKFQIDIYAYMNIQYCMNYVHTHAHTWITHLHHTMIPWILVTFPDLMTTSSDEDIPSLEEEIGYGSP